VVGASVTDRAKQESSEAAEPARAHDEQVGSLSFRDEVSVDDAPRVPPRGRRPEVESGLM
jgi:hypothetical protein